MSISGALKHWIIPQWHHYVQQGISHLKQTCLPTEPYRWDRQRERPVTWHHQDLLQNCHPQSSMDSPMISLFNGKLLSWYQGTDLPGSCSSVMMWHKQLHSDYKTFFSRTIPTELSLYMRSICNWAPYSLHFFTCCNIFMLVVKMLSEFFLQHSSHFSILINLTLWVLSQFI